MDKGWIWDDCPVKGSRSAVRQPEVQRAAAVQADNLWWTYITAQTASGTLKVARYPLF